VQAVVGGRWCNSRDPVTAGALHFSGSSDALYPYRVCYCPRCGSALFLEPPLWQEWVYPFASALDTPLPAPPHRIHIYVSERPAWVPIAASDGDPTFDENTEESIMEWHARLGLKPGD